MSASLLRAMSERLPEPTRTRVIKTLVGLRTFFVPPPADTGGWTDSARYCYSVWLRHVVLLAEVGVPLPLCDVLEIGPGRSLGTGLASLLSGSGSFFACDVVRGARPQVNGPVLEELVALFRARTAIPEDFDELRPLLASYDFPLAALGGEAQLARTLHPARVDALRALVARGGGADTAHGVELGYFAPCADCNCRPPESADLVLSHAVLEFAPDVDASIAALARVLRPGGWMSHQIDFSAHETSALWNGHWGYADLTWHLIRGRQAFCLNRLPFSRYTAALQRAGLEIVDMRTEIDDGGLRRSQLARRFAGLSDEDLRTRSAHIICRKPLAARR